MLTHIDRVFALKAPEREFFRYIRTFLSEDDPEYARIEHAYNVGRNACKNRKRQDGTTAFGHGRSVALVGMVILGIKDPVRIIAMLLHDVVEDINGWTHSDVESQFGTDVVYYTKWLSKPHRSEFSTKEARDEFYCRTFMNAPKDVLELKLPDVLHNLCTLFACPRAKQERIIGVARRVYLPLARLQGILALEIEEAIARIEATWTEKSPRSLFPIDSIQGG